MHMLYLLFEASVVRRVYTGQKIRKTIYRSASDVPEEVNIWLKTSEASMFFLLLLLK